MALLSNRAEGPRPQGPKRGEGLLVQSNHHLAYATVSYLSLIAFWSFLKL